MKKCYLLVMVFIFSLIYIKAQPHCKSAGVKAEFTYTVDTNNTVFFTNKTVPLNLYRYEWQLDYNIPLDSSIHPVYTYPSANYYVAYLNVFDSANNRCWVGDTISVNSCMTYLSYTSTLSTHVGSPLNRTV
jgi:hypothetical protein